MNAALLTRNDFKLEHGLKFKDFNFKHRLKAGKCLFHKVHVISHLKTPECSNISIYHQAPQNLVYFWIPKQERPWIDKNTRLTILLTGCQRRAAVMEQQQQKKGLSLTLGHFSRKLIGHLHPYAHINDFSQIYEDDSWPRSYSSCLRARPII